MKSRAFCRNLAVTVAIISLLSFVGIAGATEKTASIEGVVAKVDLDANKLEVKTADGTEHIMRLAKRTVVHGERASSTRGDNALRDLREEDKVVVHYTKHGTDETAEEIDQIGRSGLKTSEGTITEIDRRARTMTIKLADGAEESYRLTEHAAEDAGIETEDAAKKSAHAIVYYSEEADQKLVHFFKTSQL